MSLAMRRLLHKMKYAFIVNICRPRGLQIHKPWVCWMFNTVSWKYSMGRARPRPPLPRHCSLAHGMVCSCLRVCRVNSSFWNLNILENCLSLWFWWPDMSSCFWSQDNPCFWSSQLWCDSCDIQIQVKACLSVITIHVTSITKHVSESRLQLGGCRHAYSPCLDLSQSYDMFPLASTAHRHRVCLDLSWSEPINWVNSTR